MVELNCETDFVARNKQFLSLLQSVTDLNLTAAADTSQLDGEFSMKILEKEDGDRQGFWEERQQRNVTTIWHATAPNNQAIVNGCEYGAQRSGSILPDGPQNNITPARRR